MAIGRNCMRLEMSDYQRLASDQGCGFDKDGDGHKFS
jgi:hypothetical protein